MKGEADRGTDRQTDKRDFIRRCPTNVKRAAELGEQRLLVKIKIWVKRSCRKGCQQ